MEFAIPALKLLDRDHILTEGVIVAKYHATAGNQWKAAILDKISGKQT